ncbi:MAG: hypothetical protein Q8N96_10495, partial [Methylovulum sp.]|nr:hypothetical protein [Methylovulum sp.]
YRQRRCGATSLHRRFQPVTRKGIHAVRQSAISRRTDGVLLARKRPTFKHINKPQTDRGGQNRLSTLRCCHPLTTALMK